jgi:hypothetical protein
VTAPDGSQQTIGLYDSTLDPTRRGIFKSFYSPPAGGRYHGRIIIRNHGRSTLALSDSHPEYENKREGAVKRIDIASEAPKFVRCVSFYFDSGPRPEVKDIDPNQSERKK